LLNRPYMLYSAYPHQHTINLIKLSKQRHLHGWEAVMGAKNLVTRGIRIILLVVVLVGTSVALSASTNTWSVPQDISGWHNDLGLYPSLLMSEDGTLFAFWERSLNKDVFSIWASVRGPGEDWGNPENLSGWVHSLEVFPFVYDILWDAVVTPGGEALVIWAEEDKAQTGDNIRLQGSRRVPGGTWQTETVSPWYESYINFIDLDDGDEGHMAAAWVACTQYPLNGGICATNVRRKLPGVANWETLERLDGSLNNAILIAQVVVGPGGQIIAQWHQANPLDSNQWGLFASFYDPGSNSWTGDRYNPISGWHTFLRESPPVVDPSGTAVIAWNGQRTSGAKYAVYSSTKPAGSTGWNAAVKISPDSDYIDVPIMAAGWNGSVAISWSTQRFAQPAWAIFANVRDPGASWGAATRISEWTTLAYPPDIGVWPDGTAVALWAAQDGNRDPNFDEAVQWRICPPGGVWAGGVLGDWYDSIELFINLKLGIDGSAVAMWGISDITKPIDQSESVKASTFVPGGSWSSPVTISNPRRGVMIPLEGLAVGFPGEPVAAIWRAFRSSDNTAAVYFSEIEIQTGGGNKVYLPLVVR
jgi:hypothetical protein